MARNAIVQKGVWRESASLIVLAKDECTKGKYNYNALVMKRSEKTAMLPNHAVFPGGVTDTADDSSQWLNYFKKFGIQDQSLRALSLVNGLRPRIFKPSPSSSLAKEISLRITAIREAFEEVGLFLCRSKDNLSINSGYGAFIEDFDRAHWQKEVHDDPKKFLHLCEKLEVVPDLWSLYEWSTWLTPAAFNKRYETAFFLVALRDQPNLMLEKTEVAGEMWKNPVDILLEFHKGSIWLPPPQCYELSRLAPIADLDQMQKFAAERCTKGSTSMLPVVRYCTDGYIGILPGDDYYPEEPHKCTTMEKLNMTAMESCLNVKNCHRTVNVGSTRFCPAINIEPFDGHLRPIDTLAFWSKL